MDGHSKPIYGFLQYPQIDYPFADNAPMEITAHIAANLDDWMTKSPQLDTLKKVAARSGVGNAELARQKQAGDAADKDI